MRILTQLLKILLPPREWIFPVVFVLGLLLGVVVVILRISNATAYLSDDPKACINCHVMFPQFETWLHSSHRQYAACNDCHVPHETMINKYLFKAQDGIRHATIYSLRLEPQVIRMHEAGQKVVQSNCIRCHEKLLDGTNLVHGTYEQYLQGDAKLCWQCHREVPHGSLRSLAATPYYLVPRLPDSTPRSLESLRNFLEKLMSPEMEKENE